VSGDADGFLAGMNNSASIAAGSAVIPAGTWIVDRAHSRVGFAVRHLGISTVRGEFREFEGTLEIGDDLSTARAYGSVRVASVDTNEPGRDDDIRSSNFMDAAQFPEITFESTKIENLDGEELRIAGRLTLHGVTNDVVLHADVGGTDVDLFGYERVGLEVTGVLARSDYGIKLTQALGTGNLVVGEKITLTLDLSAIKQA
jgi:polyisoprenoid-binding protein YceI